MPFEDASDDGRCAMSRRQSSRPSTTTRSSVTSSPRNPDFKVAAEFDTGEQYGMAVKKNGNVDLLRTINDVLATLQSGGGYAAIYAKWFKSAPLA